MVCLNTQQRVPSTADARLGELAEILARGVLRMAAKKTRFGRENPLEPSAETRLSVTRSDEPDERKVT